jgi:hypothetical protein
MKVRAWLISQNAEGVGSRGVISRSAWAAVARAAEEGMVFDDYNPSTPGKVSKPAKVTMAPAPKSPVIKPTYRVVSAPIRRKETEAWTYFKGEGGKRGPVLGFGDCSRCGCRVSRCGCDGGPVPPRYTTGEVLWSRPGV